jgi:hypothetical protein
LKIRNLEGYRNYDKSEFDKPSPLLKDDEELEKVWKSEHSLQEFLAPSNFKSYEELQTRLSKVLAEDSAPAKRKAAENTEVPWQEEESAPTFKATHAPKYSSDEEDDDESLEFFKKLAND